MRLNYVFGSSEELSPEDREIYERIKLRRQPDDLLPLDRALLHSPKLADGWNSLLGAIRTRGTLPSDVREIIICRVALINRAWFEWDHHLPILQRSEGFTDDMLQVVKRLDVTGGQGPLSDKQWTALLYTDAMTRDVRVPDEIFAGLQGAGFDEQEIVEVTVTAAAYNMVSRFLVALDVGEANTKPPSSIPDIFGSLSGSEAADAS